ncbi:MAG: hypothetical protein RLP44_12810 [Aggregatilineales bacterium]
MNLKENSPLYEQCLHRHWCAQSETFTGADSLITALDRGWRIVDYTIDDTQKCYTQPIAIYVFTLRIEQTVVTMRIINNPYIARLANQLDQIIAYKESRKYAKTTLVRTSHHHKQTKKGNAYAS